METKKFLHKWMNISLKSTNIEKVSLLVEKVPPLCPRILGKYIPLQLRECQVHLTLQARFQCTLHPLCLHWVKTTLAALESSLQPHKLGFRELNYQVHLV